LIATGWVATIATGAVAQHPILPGAAPSLCWLAAALLFVHGMRIRAGVPGRGGVLAAIWMAISLAMALLLDLTSTAGTATVAAAATIPLLSAAGLLLATVAVGPRSGRQNHFNWVAIATLTAFAVANLAFVWVLLDPALADLTVTAAVPLIATLAYITLGLAIMVLLNQDLAVALERLARTDPLTGVWNRRGFDEAAPHLLEKMRAGNGTMAAVAIADIDSFKAINDRHGHNVGDAVLVGFARLLETAAHSGDLLARLGGEEFAVLAIGVDSSALFERCERVRTSAGMPNEDRSTLPSITASFGVAQVDPHTFSLRDALERADHALYRAKREGRNKTAMGVPPGQRLN
jgi:diguanylate cyclase (GGDEF)-like protein